MDPAVLAALEPAPRRCMRWTGYRFDLEAAVLSPRLPRAYLARLYRELHEVQAMERRALDAWQRELHATPWGEGGG